MPVDKRQFTRFSLDIPADLHGRFGERSRVLLQQISIGGCLMNWHDDIYPGDDFRIEIGLPNGNRLPLACRTVYRFDDCGIGVKFVDITRFEQELIAATIEDRLEKEGLPIVLDAAISPARMFDLSDPLTVLDSRMRREAKLQEIMAVDLES
jgi:hypothetical protein